MVDWSKLLKCPPRTDTQCQADLAAAKQELETCQDAEDVLTMKVSSLTTQISTLSTALMTKTAEADSLQSERDELLKLSKLLTEGPDIPDMSKVRWLPQAYIDTILNLQMGTKYTLCPAKHFAESDYLVCSKEEMTRFIQYYAMFWMPHIKYVTQQWNKLDGSQVEIWMNDCDNYSDFFKGIPAINANWACFPWGQVWADVQGFTMAGGHAFNILICCDDTYKETSAVGLKAYLLEPQMAGGGPWPAARQQITSYELKELKEVAGFFEIKGTMWMVKF